MKRKLSIAALQAAVVVFVGCGDNSPTAPVPVDPKVEVQAAHISWLADYLAERADAFAARLAPGAIDVGGGPTGTGALPPEFFTEAYWRARMNSSEFDPLRGKSVDEVIDPATTLLLTKAEAEARLGVDWTTSPFRMLDGDLLANTDPRVGSPLSDGWFGVYRKIDGVWRVVALD